MNPMKSNIGMMALLMASIAIGIPDIDQKIATKPKQLRKCTLPSCGITHTHNGGYCCAEHCKIHKNARKLLKDLVKDLP